MAAIPLSLTVDACTEQRSRRRSVFGFAASVLLQGLALASLAVTPLLTTDDLPEPHNRTPIGSFIPVIRVPSLPPAGPRRAQPATSNRAPSARPSFDLRRLAPVHVPVGIPEETAVFEGGFEVGLPVGIPVGIPGAPPWGVAEQPAEPQAPRGPLVIGEGVTPPRKLHHVDPVYPRSAIFARVSGTVVLEAMIDERGSVTGLMVRQSIPLLDGAAIEAVRQWRYEPTLLHGRPTPVLLTVSVTFELAGREAAASAKRLR